MRSRLARHGLLLNTTFTELMLMYLSCLTAVMPEDFATAIDQALYFSFWELVLPSKELLGLVKTRSLQR